MHALQNIAESGAQPMSKVEKLRGGAAPIIGAALWAQTAIALCMEQASKWTTLAHQLFPMTTEEREAAIKAWKDWKTAKTKAFASGDEQHPKMDEKAFKRIMATATVRLSHMSTIAKALDSGMDAGTLAAWYKCEIEEVPYMSIDMIYEVAKTFSKSKAGRKPDSFEVKLGKFLEAAAKTLADEDVDYYNKVVKAINNLSA